MKRRDITEEERKEIINLVKEGYSYKKVGEKFGLTHAGVKYICDKEGIASSHKSYLQKAKISEEETEEMIKDAFNGMPVIHIAKKYGVTPLAVVNKLKTSRYGLDLYPLSSEEEKIYDYLLEHSAFETAERFNIPVEEIREFAYSRKISISTVKKWSRLEERELEQYIDTCIPDNVKKELSVLLGRSETAIGGHLTKMRKARGVVIKRFPEVVLYNNDKADRIEDPVYKTDNTSFFNWNSEDIILLRQYLDMNLSEKDIAKELCYSPRSVRWMTSQLSDIKKKTTLIY